MTKIYEFILADGDAFGCGTAYEFSYWQGLGIHEEGAKLGKVIGHEDPSEDEKRRKAWA